MIPKIIHYCWFGGNPLPEKLQNYINGWKEKMPDYEIMEWNEKNFDISNSIDYVKEAYQTKKYAFVSDYVRLFALVNYGGIYLDTDVEIVKPLDELLQNVNLLAGFERRTDVITAMIACDKGNKVIQEFFISYQNRHFIKETGEMDITTINEKFTELLQKKGIVMNNAVQSINVEDEIIQAYPFEYFSGYDIEHSHEKITENTYTIHHFEGSWNKKFSFKIWLKYKVVARILQKLLGYEKYDKLIDKKHGIK